MSEFLFHVQWWIPCLLALIGAVLFWNGNKVQVIRLRNAGAAIVALAVLWAIASYLVDTDQEKVENGTRGALADVVDANWAQFQGRLLPSVVFNVAGGNGLIDSADKLTAFARSGAETVKLKSARAQNLTLEQHGTLITAHFDVLSTQDSYAPIETSTWDFDWEQTPGGWRIREIRLLKLNNVDNPADVVPRAVPKR